MKRLKNTVCIVALLAINASAWAEVTASVNRNILSENDTFKLTIRATGDNADHEPDTSILNKDFVVLGTSQSTRYQSSGLWDKNATSTTDWIITLAPRGTGVVVIPSFTLGNLSTDSITVAVSSASFQTNNSNSSQDVFLRSSIEKSSGYVQEQIIYTQRLHYAVSISENYKLSKPEVQNAVVKQLGQAVGYETMVEGRRYNVAEWQFVIIPQQSGSLKIPKTSFTGSKFINQQNNGNWQYGSNRQERVRSQGDEHTITVKPKPANYPANKPWLPAKELTMIESWSDNVGNIYVGDSVTRTVTINADGLSASQLAPLELSTLNNAKFYPEQAQTEDKSNQQGITGKRVERGALVATHTGTIEIPEESITWWDIDEDKIKISTIDARTIQVLATTGERNNTIAPITPMLLTTDNNGDTTTIVEKNGVSYGWMIACGLLLLAWLFTLALLLQTRQQMTDKNDDASNNKKDNPSERKAFNKVKSACMKKDNAATKQALLQWANSYWLDKTTHTLENIAHNSESNSFKSQLIALDNALYGNNNTPINYETIIQGIENIKQQSETTEEKLANLYPI